MFDDKIKQENDAPTIGIILCTDKDESMVKYSVLADKENLYAANYMAFMPTEEELKATINHEREIIERRLMLDKERE